ncbi:uncharacterized protein [Primulina eburnea]|uniref:uncharacterized protein n=1 Tax=Primulina eburnea TaxID=1245227 RepID=UPI003C6BE3B2
MVVRQGKKKATSRRRGRGSATASKRGRKSDNSSASLQRLLTSRDHDDYDDEIVKKLSTPQPRDEFQMRLISLLKLHEFDMEFTLNFTLCFIHQNKIRNLKFIISNPSKHNLRKSSTGDDSKETSALNLWFLGDLASRNGIPRVISWCLTPV